MNIANPRTPNLDAEIVVRIADWLRDKLEKKGINCLTFSKMSGLKHSMVYDYANGRRGMKLSTFIKICESLEIHPSKGLNEVLNWSKK